MRVDAHQHFWTINRTDYGWLTPRLKVLYRDYLPEHLEETLKRHGIDKTIVVQAAPTMDETDYMLGLYEQCDWIAGVIGWLDLDSPDFDRHYDRYRAHPGFVGFRPMLQDLPDPWILRPQVLANLKLVERDRFPLDLQLRVRHLPYMLEALRRLPELHAVVDHAAKPFIAEGVLEPWATQLMELAAYPGIMCKLSGLVTEANQASWTPDDLAPYVRHVWQAFGSSRVMYGSDWPVCLDTCSYDDVYAALLHALPAGLAEEERAAVFGGNAVRFYRVG